MIRPFVVTGATGVLGRALTATFAEAGVAVRQAVRDPRRAGSAGESIRFDYLDPTTFDAALAGAGGLVLMAPPLDPEAPAKLEPVIASAKANGVGQIVFISAFGVNQNEQAPLRVVEHLVMDSGVAYTILRPNFFMENFSEGFLAGGIRAQNGIFLAAGDGKTSFVSVQDVANVALAAFQKRLSGQELDLTGPESLDHVAVAQAISDVSGRTVQYYALSEEQMISGARSMGMPEAAIGYLTVLYGVVRAGYAAGIAAGAEQATGRSPRSFQEFARESASAWS